MTTLVERWTEVGFSDYEAKVYVALLRLGQATGYQAAKESGVPRSVVYEVLNKLVARGAVVTQSFKNMVRYAAIPSDQLVSRIRREMEDSLGALSRGMKEVAAGPSGLGSTWNLTLRKNILAYARQMIERAETEVALLVGDDDELDELLPRLTEAHARGIFLLVISPVPYQAGVVPLVTYRHGKNLRQKVGHGFTLVVDEKEALIAEIDRSESAVWTTNGFAVAWTLWCLKKEMGRNAPRKSRSARSRSAASA